MSNEYSVQTQNAKSFKAGFNPTPLSSNHVSDTAMEFLREHARNTSPVRLANVKRQAKTLVGLLFAHRARFKLAQRPRVRVTLNVTTPCGKAAARVQV
jgi:hypothetical protein